MLSQFYIINSFRKGSSISSLVNEAVSISRTESKILTLKQARYEVESVILNYVLGNYKSILAKDESVSGSAVQSLTN